MYIWGIKMNWYDDLRIFMKAKRNFQNRFTEIQKKKCWQIDFEIQSAVATLSQWEQTWIGNWSRVNFSLCKCTNCQVKNVTTFCFLGVSKKTVSHWRHLGQNWDFLSRTQNFGGLGLWLSESVTAMGRLWAGLGLIRMQLFTWVFSSRCTIEILLLLSQHCVAIWCSVCV